ncbi:MAG: NUDIX domain-containing protein [Patescibacteria group bacterium]|nr:NUDIX domain-containing protein [Patescibacteria group bacterium]
MDLPKPIKVKAMCIIKRPKDGAVLASLGYDKIKNEHFARIIGGHVEFGETSEETLRREFREELDTDIAELKFIKAIENIFTYDGESSHEIVFLYSGKLGDADIYDKESMRIIDSPDTEVRWISKADVDSGKLKIYPEYGYWESN